ncbi:MAG TPA: glutathione S-transferase N-terminal domain-containing protein [Usitatibacteraceae bacterium]|nr:glutathione S-transferase N-terminal domain-containing protein [Usitatibacteraceae bacterium]
MNVTLYYSPGACSLAPHIVLEELGLAYGTVRISTAEGQQRSPEYLKINPRGRVPALVVDGKVLVENVAILTFLGGGFAARGLWPEQTWDQAQALSLMAWLADTVHPAFAHFYRPERYVEGSRCVDAVKAAGRESFGQHLAEIDRLVAGKKWAVGNRFSVLDAYLLVFYRWGNRNGFAVQGLASYAALVGRILARPAVKKVMADEGITMT